MARGFEANTGVEKETAIKHSRRTLRPCQNMTDLLGRREGGGDGAVASRRRELHERTACSWDLLCRGRSRCPSDRKGADYISAEDTLDVDYGVLLKRAMNR